MWEKLASYASRGAGEGREAAACVCGGSGVCRTLAYICILYDTVGGRGWAGGDGKIGLCCPLHCNGGLYC